MIRTQISLDRDEYLLAKKEAKRHGVSVAEYFRRALRRVLPLDRKKSWMRFCGLIESGNPKSSQEIDSIYDEKE
jgi:hypothetical protein